MIRVLTVLLLGALALAADSAAAQEWSAPPGWEVAKTPHSYANLIERLDAAVKANKMGLVTRASATLGAKALGKTIPGNMVIGVYHPRFAVRMLEASIPAGIEAPTVTINRSDLEQVMMGAVSFDDQIAAGKAKLVGNKDVYKQLKSTLVQFELGFELMPGTGKQKISKDRNPFQQEEPADTSGG